MITKILVILMMVLAFFLGAFIAKATSAQLPDGFSYIADFPIIAVGFCTEIETQKSYVCEYRLDKDNNEIYLIVYIADGNVNEILRAGKNGEETIFKAAKKLKL